ncbi:glycosyltransferase family 2 protein [Candidatus Peregrinibacteria bacterium]|jgi:glycosyltransferase involved in cell wall biosynthesis|nr:glycosyltransferase family 2 protein [Candidatus Peregrinibacteria bacterium]MBT3598291.1 glycosyltransferase family 2 protein [Candidatus Peregrinibacteria bacterium]MBT4367226.1 glycosyltransferase family 2 protein [Candidatus Peregrinibacteria bacterium]MBT4586253.1 glycosyltransferase family 2 protein [Candidatus Peregrinibacteria bacterium]MBT6731036.1 glycosyltransferase family 2 protein [Candidatus Peregrinibacteria bacterium]
MLKLSVIIPTYQRAETLQTCIEHLSKQTISEHIEVIVVSDGHDEKTVNAIKEMEDKIQVPIFFYEIPKSQQGVARNFGVAKAKSPICLFIGDDIFLDHKACEKHMEAHKDAGDIAVLGFTTWDTEMEITPVMKWLEISGWQFAYPKIKKYKKSFLPSKTQHQFSYTSHISVPTHIALKYPFKIDTTLYGWEDIEWGEKLKQNGIPLFYEPDAKALHHHHISLQESISRMQVLGESIVQFKNTDRFPRLWKRTLIKISTLIRPSSFASMHRKAFLNGIKIAQKK